MNPINKLEVRKQRIVYAPTVYGLYSSAAKKLNFPSWLIPDAGEETWHIEGGPDRLIDKGGRPSITTTEELKKLRDNDRDNYFHPILGAGERWKASMDNNTNPFRGLFRTVVPAVGTAAAIYYTPTIVSNASRLIPKVAKTVIAHPSLSAHIGKKVATKVGTDLFTGILGGSTVNNITELSTGKSWGELAAPYLGVSKGLADWTNPGYIIGPGIAKRFINPNIDKIFNTKIYLAEDESKLKYLNNALQKNEHNLSDLNNEIDSNVSLRGEAYNKWNQLNEKISDLQQLVLLLSPINLGLRKEAYLYYREMSNAVRSDEFPVNDAQYSLAVPKDTPIRTLDLGGLNIRTSFPLVFTNLNGKEFKSVLDIFPKSPLKLRTTRDLYYVPLVLDKDKLVPDPERLIEITGMYNFGDIFKNNAPEVQKGISEYVDNLNSLMGDNGTVAGSLIHYKNGIFPATNVNGTLIGPADTEIYTTLDRLPELINKLLFRESTLNSVGGHKGTSPYTFRGDSNHRGIDTEINVIELDRNGNASGKLAHQIYRALYPELYSELMYKHALSPITEGSFSETSLPISAENLFLIVNRNPQAMLLHLLTDMVGMETFTNPNHIKASKRLFSTLFNEYGNTPEILGNALRAHGKYNLGGNFKLATELYPNMLLNDTNANIEFLKNVYGLTDELAAKFAANPKVMANAVNLYDFQNSVGVRLTGRDVVTDVAKNGLQWHNPKIELFTGNGSFSGGNGSGDGLNRALLNPAGGWRFSKIRGDKPMDLVSVTLAPLTLYPEKIKTPLDLLNQVNRLKTTERQLDMSAPLLTSSYFSRSEPLEYDTKRIQNIYDLAKLRDIPVNFNMGEYGYGYLGSYVPPIAAGARRSAHNDAHELGSLLKDIIDGDESGGSLILVPTELVQFVLDNLRDVVPKGFEDIKKAWKNSSIRERVNCPEWGSSVTSCIRFIPHPYDYEELRNAPYIKKLSELQYDYGLNTKKYFEGRDEYIEGYNNVKQQLNNAIHEGALANHEKKLLLRKIYRLYDLLHSYLDERELLRQALNRNLNHLLKLRVNKIDARGNLAASGFISATAVLPFMLNEISNRGKNEEIQYDNRITDEKFGYANPIKNRHYFTNQFYDYSDLGYSDNQATRLARLDVQKAYQLYKQNKKRHASKYLLGGELNYTHNRFPITKSLNLNVVYDPKFQPKRDINPNFGDVEYMTAEHNVLPYYHNYKKPAKYKNKSTIIYNNNLGDTANESVALDALSHGLRELDKDWKEYFLPNLTKVWSKNDYVLGDLDKNGDDPLGNAVDGNIRNLLVLDKYRHLMRYSPIQEVYKATVHTPLEKKAWSEAYEYITGNKVLPNGKSLIVTPRGSYISK